MKELLPYIFSTNWRRIKITTLYITFSSVFVVSFHTIVTDMIKMTANTMEQMQTNFRCWNTFGVLKVKYQNLVPYKIKRQCHLIFWVPTTGATWGPYLNVDNLIWKQSYECN